MQIDSKPIKFAHKKKATCLCKVIVPIRIPYTRSSELTCDCHVECLLITRGKNFLHKINVIFYLSKKLRNKETTFLMGAIAIIVCTAASAIHKCSLY